MRELKTAREAEEFTEELSDDALDREERKGSMTMSSQTVLSGLRRAGS